jgi:anti-anti-sigma factor
MDPTTRITTEENDTTLRVCIAGEIDIASALDQVEVRDHHEQVIVDTSAVTFAGSQFLSWLLVVKQRAALVLTAPSEAVIRLVDLAGLRDEFTIEPGPAHGGTPPGR